MLAKKITDIDALPNCAVLTSKQVAALLSISPMTLWEIGQTGQGPPRIQVSPRRFGYPLGQFKQWLAQREAA